MNKRFQWIAVEYILPNPRNPRKDARYKSNEIKKILKEKGFEEAIVAYRGSGLYFYIISGHRRFQAAVDLGAKEIPVYIVDAPKSQLEELERLGSIQSNQTDWTEYEWLVHTVNLKKHRNNYEELASLTTQSVSIVKKRIAVVTFFESSEIEMKLNNKTYSLNQLFSIRLFIERVKKSHPIVIEHLGSDYIRNCLLKKLDNRLLASDLAIGNYIEKASADQIKNFIIDLTQSYKTFKHAIDLMQLETKRTSLNANLKVIKEAKKEIELLKFKRKEEALFLHKGLCELEKQVTVFMKNLTKPLEVSVGQE